MRKTGLFLLVLVALLVMFPAVSMASFHISNSGVIETDSHLPYDIYLGYVSRFDKLPQINFMPAVGQNAKVEHVGSSMYSSLFHIQVGAVQDHGAHFQLSTANGLYVLMNSALDIIGTYSELLDPSVIVVNKETYQLMPGQTVALTGYSFNNPGYTKWVAGADYSNKCYDGWSINGMTVPQNLSYDYLTQTLGLAAGTYDLRLEARWDWGSDDLVLDDYATTTITIVPEPATTLMLGSSLAVFVRRRQRD